MWRFVLVAILAFVTVAASAESELSFKDIDDNPLKLDIIQVTQQRIMQGYPDGKFCPKNPLLECEFSVIIERLLALCPDMSKTDFQTKTPEKPITRLRAITVLLRSAVGKKAVEAIGETGGILSSCADVGMIPEWGIKYAAYAVDRGYVRVDGTFRPNDNITRGELAGILARFLPPISESSTASSSDGYTGLVVDCRGLKLGRSYSPSLASENGGQIYPDVKNLPTDEFIEDHGLVSYATEASCSIRAGDRPLKISAIAIQGTAQQTAVISTSDRDAILAEEAKYHFMAHWNVVFLIGPKQEPASEPTAQQE